MSRSMKFLLVGIGVVVVLGAGFSACNLDRTAGPEADVRIITRGEEVDLEAHAVQGKYTVFDFYAAWCPPCRVLSPALERLAAAQSERLAIRKVDIVDWTMPVAAQHGVESLPYLVLFDPERRRVASGEEVSAMLLQVFGENAREVAEATGVEVPEQILGVESADDGLVM
ncbi:MAG TPA: thioredoxin family protein [Candidatus Polarisedimenticolia bacterium]|nr:thioredoxin family protein [Candidatus Polarisedimenticolia bacterium]